MSCDNFLFMKKELMSETGAESSNGNDMFRDVEVDDRNDQKQRNSHFNYNVLIQKQAQKQRAENESEAEAKSKAKAKGKSKSKAKADNKSKADSKSQVDPSNDGCAKYGSDCADDKKNTKYYFTIT